MPSSPKARVLVVEDDELIRDALEIALEREGYEVRGDEDGRKVEEAAEVFVPDLAILDVNLQTGPDGYTIARRLRGKSSVPILFLTGADAVADRLAGFEAGGDDYMAKPFDMDEVLARTRALLRRAGKLSSAVRQVGDLIVDEGRRTVVKAGRLIDVTPTEYQLLSMLARHPGQVLSRGQLLTHIGGYDDPDSNVVNVHLSSLRRKFQGHGPPVLHTVRGMGYSLHT